LFKWALEDEVPGVRSNPARDVSYLRGRQGGFHSWAAAEVEQYENHHPIGTTARLALALLLYTGQRRSDVVLFGRQHVRQGSLRFTQQKNRNKAGLPHCTSHGLRKTGAAIAAENGATAHELMSIFGWLTLKEAERYTRAAEQKKIAAPAMSMLQRGEKRT
jgi:integrase